MGRVFPAAVLLLAVTLGFVAAQARAAIVADHHAVAAFDSIPESYFQDVRDQHVIFYGHTSHGSQIVTGVNMLASEDGGLFLSPGFDELWSDLGHTGSLVWEGQTRDHLQAHPATNLVMWSWCGGCSDNTDAGIDTYLQAMSQLEMDFPGVTFIYMTGHLDGSGEEGLLRHNNNRIREYCLAQDKVLFDFADIESWSPDGVYHPDETDACGWCAQWCEDRECPSCESCAHSHCFNCYRKGKAFWWMMARITGWQGVPLEKRDFGAVKALYRGGH